MSAQLAIRYLAATYGSVRLLMIGGRKKKKKANHGGLDISNTGFIDLKKT